MENEIVKDFMIELNDYVTVPEGATLVEAVCALRKAQAEFDDNHYPHQAILVTNKKGAVIGKISHHDILEAIEPKHLALSKSGRLKEYNGYLGNMITKSELWIDGFAESCKKARNINVKEFMYKPTDGEYVRDDCSLKEASLLLVSGRHRSLLVTRRKKVVGVLRMSDVVAYAEDNILAP